MHKNIKIIPTGGPDAAIARSVDSGEISLNVLCLRVCINLNN